MSTSPRPPAVSTVSLLAYLATIYAWMLEGLVLVIHLFTNRNLDPLGHWTLTLCLSSDCVCLGSRQA